MACWSWRTLVNVPRAKMLLGQISKNQRSTKFSQELLVGVKCM